MNYILKNKEIEYYNEIVGSVFPKYTSQLINCANQNAQGTRAVVVGQMSDLFLDFMASGNEMSIEAWKAWYIQKHPDAFKRATDKIYSQIRNLQEAIKLVDEGLVRRWVEDLVVNKTFNGLYVQKAILASLAKRMNTSYRLANQEEESQGIDGYVGGTPYSIKPDSYKTMNRLSETINVKMIYYKKDKTGLKIEVEE